MKRNFSKRSRRPHKGNGATQAPRGASSATGQAHAREPSDQGASALEDLAGVFREAARDLARNAESLFAQDAPERDAASPRLEELLREGVTASIDRHVETWKARLDDQTASRTVDLLVYNAAAILGRRIAEQEHGPQLEEDERALALDLLARLGLFVTLFGYPETWNGQAARRFVLERLAAPLGLVDEDDAGRLFFVIDAAKELLTACIARSWRDMVGALLDLPLQIPAHPNPTKRWADALEIESLGHALERAAADDGLVRVMRGHSPVITRCLMSGDSAWMLVCERTADDEAPSMRIDQVATAEVRAALDHAETTAVEHWRLEELACPTPHCAIRLPARARPDARATEMMLVRGNGDPDAAKLVVMDALPDGWGVWAISCTGALPGHQGAPLLLTDDPAALPSGVDMCHFEARPLLVRGDVQGMLALVPGSPARIARLGPRIRGIGNAGKPGSLPVEYVAELGDLGADPIHAVYSLPAGPEQPGRYLLVAGERALHVYRSGVQGMPWWNGWPLVRVAHLDLVANVSVFDVVDDLIVFRVADGFWTFFPVQALEDGAPLPFAAMRAEARGILFQPPAGAANDDILPPPSWIRMGQLHDLASDDSGSISVTFSDSAWIDVYERKDDGAPAHVRSVEGRRGTRGARIAQMQLEDGRCLFLRASDDRIEYRRVSPTSPARDTVFAT